MYETIDFIETVPTPIYLVVDETEKEYSRVRVGTSFYEYDYGKIETKHLFDVVDERVRELNVYPMINDWLKMCRYYGWPLHNMKCLEIDRVTENPVDGNLVQVLNIGKRK